MAKAYYYRAGDTPVTMYFLYLYHKALGLAHPQAEFDDYHALNKKWDLMNEVICCVNPDYRNALQGIHEAQTLHSCYLFAKKMGW